MASAARHAALHLLLETLGRPRDERGVVVLEQQYRRGVHPKDLDDPGEQLVEQRIERQVRQRGVRDRLEITEPVGGDARLHGADSLSSYGWSRSRTASL